MITTFTHRWTYVVLRDIAPDDLPDRLQKRGDKCWELVSCVCESKRYLRTLGSYTLVFKRPFGGVVTLQESKLLRNLTPPEYLCEIANDKLST